MPRSTFASGAYFIDAVCLLSQIFTKSFGKNRHSTFVVFSSSLFQSGGALTGGFIHAVPRLGFRVRPVRLLASNYTPPQRQAEKKDKRTCRLCPFVFLTLMWSLTLNITRACYSTIHISVGSLNVNNQQPNNSKNKKYQFNLFL